LRFIITGALGHIGSALIRSLPRHFPQCQFVLMDNLATLKQFSLPRLSQDRFKMIEADIRTFPFGRFLRKNDVVIHLAALTDPQESLSRAGDYFSTNTHATREIAAACLKKNAKLLFPSTTGVYGKGDAAAAEETPVFEKLAATPYTASKIRAEKALIRLHQKQGLQVCVLRLATLFGPSPGMRFHTAINRFCWQAAAGLPLTVWEGALRHSKPYLDLNDALRLIRFVIRKNFFDGEVFNAASMELTGEEAAETFRKILPVKIRRVPSPVRGYSTRVSTEKIRKRGFRFQGCLETSIRKTLALLHV
jgi:nucleoside-diphosphate-sugar epimerase